MLHHGGDGDGGHHQDGRDVELGNAAAEVGEERLEAQQRSDSSKQALDIQSGEVHHASDQGHHIGDDHTQQDGDDLHHALAPDIGHHDDSDGHQCQPPAGGGVGHSRGSQIQTDEDDDGAGDHRGQEVHDLVDAHHLDNGGQHHIQQARHHDAAAGVLQLLSGVHTGVDALVHSAHGGETAQEREGGTQESGDLHFGADMEEQRAEAGEEQCGLDAQGQAVALDQDRHQHGGAEHGEHVLQSQDQHLGEAQGPGIPDGLLTDVCFLLVHIISPLKLIHTGKKNTGTNSRSKKGKIRKRGKCRFMLLIRRIQHAAFPPFVIFAYYTERYDVLQE